MNSTMQYDDAVMRDDAMPSIDAWIQSMQRVGEPVNQTFDALLDGGLEVSNTTIYRNPQQQRGVLDHVTLVSKGVFRHIECAIRDKPGPYVSATKHARMHSKQHFD